MSGRRGRPRKPLPVHPNRVLSQAIKKGLTTAVTLQGRIKNRTTRHLYESSKKIWKTATKRYRESQKEFQHIIDAENNIRKNGLQMLFEKAAAYGNTEVSRVKSSDDTIGPLNQRFNIGGAALRDFALAMYPFPDPEELPSGRTGYRKSSHGPEVVPIHAIPELDFIDCVRQHVQVLCTHCYIFDVSNQDTGRYTNLFLLRVRPYLDRIYSEGKCGLKGFQAGTMRVLREIKNEIAKNYTVRSGTRETVTSRLEFEPPTFSTDFFRDQIEEAKIADVNSIFTDEIERLLDGGSLDRDENDDSLPCLNERDVWYIWGLASKRARRRGSQVHRHLLTQFPSFWDIRRAILNDGSVDSKDGYILCSEMNIDTEAGSGRADILLLRREAALTGQHAVWRPVLLLDLKTRLGFNWSLSHTERYSESRRNHGLPQRVVPDFTMQTRPLDEKEWSSIIQSIPNSQVREQVSRYANAIAEAYEEVTDEPCPGVPIGTLVVDAETDLRTFRSVLRPFIIRVYESLPSKAADYPRTAFHLQSHMASPRAAIIVHRQRIPTTSNRVPLPPVWNPPFDPLQGTYSRKGSFILNISAKSPTSSGASAARIAGFWHGMEFLLQLVDGMESPRITWLDLADEFSQLSLTEARLRYRSFPREVSDLFESISIYEAFQEIHDYLFKANEHSLKSCFRSSGEEIIVVSGWDWIQRATPELFRARLNQLLAKILDKIPDASDTTVVWFDSPVPDQSSTPVYSTRTLLPFYTNSPLFGEVTEIVWNLPVAPRSEILPQEWTLAFDSISPCHDEIRVILHQFRNDYNVELTQIPPLINWSNRFRGEKSPHPFKPISAVSDVFVPDSDSRRRMRNLSLSFMPWLFNLYPSTKIKDKTKITVEVETEALGISSEFEPSLLERMHLRPRGMKDGLSYIPLTANRINSQRSYRFIGQLKSNLLPSYYTETAVEETQVVFGQVITLPQADSNTEILVCEDPYSPGRILVGMFTESSIPSDTGFVWTKLDVSRLDDISNCDPDDLEVKHLMYTETEEGLGCWEKSEDDSEWTPLGLVNMIRGEGGRLAILIGIRVIPDVLADAKKPTLQFPENFDAQSMAILERLREITDQALSVNVNLVEEEDQCRITFRDPREDDMVHDLKVQGTSDIVSLLRYPSVEGKSIKTPSGLPITWDIFNDIDYGQFSSIRSLVETNAPGEARKVIAPVITKILEPTGESIEIILRHDSDACPIITGKDTQHGACWRLLSSSENDTVSGQLDSLYTGKEIYGQLSTGRIRLDNSIYSIDLSFGHTQEESEFYAYHEDKWIRRLFHENDIYLKKLTPGTFILIPEQKWTLHFTLHNSKLEWIAVSSVTGFLLDGISFTYVLNPKYNLQETINDFFNNLTSHIDIEKTTNLDESIMLLEAQLRNLGFGSDPPPFRLEVSRDENTIRISLNPTGDKESIPINIESHQLSEASNHEDFLESFYYRLEEGDLSGFNIINESDFIANLNHLLNNWDSSSTSNEGGKNERR
ncbi:MAG: hypothetical protein ACFFER_05230 [Candidatus Thorarchaeota archaeon]